MRHVKYAVYIWCKILLCVRGLSTLKGATALYLLLSLFACLPASSRTIEIVDKDTGVVIVAITSKAQEKQVKSKDWRQTWMGAHITNKSWSIYSGTTIAPFGGIHSNALLFRSIAGYGGYSYVGARALGKTQRTERFHGRQAFGEVVAGYQWRLGELTLKAFGGIAGNGHIISPKDPNNTVSGSRFGPTASIEAWLNLPYSNWLSSNTSWSSVFRSFKADLRLGHRFHKSIDLGLEAGAIGDKEYQAGHIGGFTQYRWNNTELRLSAGITSNRDKEISPYGTFNLLFTY